MFNVQGGQYTQVMVVAPDGEYYRGGGYTTEIPECLGTKELQGELLSRLPQGPGRCSPGCHDLLVVQEDSEISIYLAFAGFNQ